MKEPRFTTIWKFSLEIRERQEITIPQGAAFLRLQFYNNHAGRGAYLWATVDNEAPTVEMDIIAVGTGRPLRSVGSFLGTVIDGPYVWHFFTGPNHALEPCRSLHYQTRGNPS